jgi:hypothetical protein
MHILFYFFNFIHQYFKKILITLNSEKYREVKSIRAHIKSELKIIQRISYFLTFDRFTLKD